MTNKICLQTEEINKTEESDYLKMQRDAHWWFAGYRGLDFDPECPISSSHRIDKWGIKKCPACWK